MDPPNVKRACRIHLPVAAGQLLPVLPHPSVPPGKVELARADLKTCDYCDSFASWELTWSPAAS